MSDSSDGAGETASEGADVDILRPLPERAPSEAQRPRQDHAAGTEQGELGGVVEAILEQRFSGPLPHPQLLREYEDVLPGLADRIVGMAEHQASHRQDMERVELHGAVNAERMGVYAGLSISAAFLIAAVVLVLNGYTVPGTVLGTIDIVALAGVFVYGRRSNEKGDDQG